MELKQAEGRRAGELWGVLGASALYAAAWGCLLSMAGLGREGAWALLPGLLAALGLGILPPGRARRFALAGLLGAAVCAAALGWAQGWEGAKGLLNRLFLASEARQSYEYELLPTALSAAGFPAALRRSLLPLGLLTGAGCAGAGRRAWGAAGLFAALCAVMAYLGVVPRWPWLALLTAGVGLCCLRVPRGRGAGLWAGAGVLLALGALWAGTLALWPGELAGLSAWEEGARDALSGARVAYVSGQYVPPSARETPPPQETLFYREEETLGDEGGAGDDLLRPLPGLLAILLFALALFLPAVLSDRVKRKRARNRAGLSHPEHAQAIQAAFRCALRWLELAGLEESNAPYSACGPAVEAVTSPGLRREFEAVLPLWQEAAYSGHPMTEPQRRQMAAFLERTEGEVWAGLNRRRRLLARWVYAL